MAIGKDTELPHKTKLFVLAKAVVVLVCVVVQLICLWASEAIVRLLFGEICDVRPACGDPDIRKRSSNYQKFETYEYGYHITENSLAHRPKNRSI